MAEMETVTEVSTPAENVVEDTSSTVEPAQADTLTDEPETAEVSAETETETKSQKEEVKLFADKYKTIEDFEKGYKSLQGDYTRAKDFEAKYNGLLKAQQEIEEKNRALQFHNANQRGFRTPEEAEIADRVQLAEFNYYYQNSNNIAPEYAQEVNNLLSNYYQTGNRAYLEEAKRYYSSDFIENVAIAKSNLEKNLKYQNDKKQNEIKEKAQEELANTLKTEFAEFLGDIQQNSAKSQALEMFCKADFINSVDDMKVFQQIYTGIVNAAIENYKKELETKKAIDETKQRAVISNGNGATDTQAALPTREALLSNPDAYKKAVAKYGEQKVDEIIMKG